MTKLEVTVDVAQRLMEAVLIGPVGYMMHIQKGILPFMQIFQSFIFYLRAQGIPDW